MIAIESLVSLAESAGAAILDVYRSASAATMTTKGDGSPLTLADERSHEVIAAGLLRLAPGVPVLSEEGRPADARGLSTGLRWIVDPLDGTKEFLKRTGEFTVNIALVDDQWPLVGVVHAPVLGVSWTGSEGRAERWSGGERRPIFVEPDVDDSTLRIVASRDHAGVKVHALLARVPGARTLNLGSSLKFCHIAEGQADLYLRDGPTMEWDTAAAQGVVEAAGGQVLTLDGARLAYGKEGWRNPEFVVVGSRALKWRTLVSAPGPTSTLHSSP